MRKWQRDYGEIPWYSREFGGLPVWAIGGLLILILAIVVLISVLLAIHG